MIMARHADGSASMFDAIAGRYDLLNRVISLGQDGRWRRRLVESTELGRSAKVLDLAAGTADVTIEFLRRHPDCHVTALDPSENMLDEGRKKIETLGFSDRTEFVVGDAQDLAFSDSTFDAVTIAMGIRNVPDRGKALREMARVARPGARVCVLELAEPRGPLAIPARFYVKHVVPRVGAFLSSSDEYRYLSESIAAFPKHEAFREMMEGSGLAVLDVRTFMFGGVVLFVSTPREGGPR